MNDLLTTKASIASGVVDRDVLINLRAAYQQDSAPAINWLISMIGMLRDRIRSGGAVVVHEPMVTIEIRDDSQFMDWVRSEFPDVASASF